MHTYNRNLLIIPIVSLSLVGASLPAVAAPQDAVKDMTEKLEHCKSRKTQAERRECFDRARTYCLKNYSPDFCKKVFKQFRDARIARFLGKSEPALLTQRFRSVLSAQ